MLWNLIATVAVISCGRTVSGQAVNWTGFTSFEDVHSADNTWTIGVPKLTLGFTSTSFVTSASGLFNFDYKNSAGSAIETCQFLVTSSACTKNCLDNDNIFMCTGTPSTGLVVTLNITAVSRDKDMSEVTLPQVASSPVTLDTWSFEPLVINIKNCTNETDGLQSIASVEESISCDYLCSANVLCAAGYSATEPLMATCQANNTWIQNATCHGADCKDDGDAGMGLSITNGISIGTAIGLLVYVLIGGGGYHAGLAIPAYVTLVGGSSCFIVGVAVFYSNASCTVGIVFLGISLPLNIACVGISIYSLCKKG